jgi:hypothetical protein
MVLHIAAVVRGCRIQSAVEANTCHPISKTDGIAVTNVVCSKGKCDNPRPIVCPTARYGGEIVLLRLWYERLYRTTRQIANFSEKVSAERKS